MSLAIHALFSICGTDATPVQQRLPVFLPTWKELPNEPALYLAYGSIPAAGTDAAG
jgi:hypothetical protein